MIAAGVREIRENLHGYPPALGAPDGKWAADTELDDEQGLAAWGSILDLIVEGFEIYAEEGGYPLQSTAEAKERSDKVDQAKRLFVYWYGHLWD